MTEVKVGQIWADNDKRSSERQLKVIALGTISRRTGRPGSKYEDIPIAICLARRVTQGTKIPFTGREYKIQLSRFKPNSTGYRLVAESEAQLEQQQ